jgi:hypothetical protein
MNKHKVGELIFAPMDNEVGIITKITSEDKPHHENYLVYWSSGDNLFHDPEHISALKLCLKEHLEQPDN